MRGHVGWTKPRTGPAEVEDRAPLDDEWDGIGDHGDYDAQISPSTEILLSEQGAVDKLADWWANLWLEKETPCPLPEGQFDDDIDNITTDYIIEAIKTFPVGTGLGTDD